ncbi:MAG: choice-of-anchor V domain-containing protein, partial [Bacteroidota bacterium]
MKTKFIPIAFICLSLGIFAFRSEIYDLNSFHKSPLNSGGVAAGKTGAPGEQNCTQCHSGNTQDGSNENVLTLLDGTTPVTTYSPGQQYTVTLSMSSNPVKKGFQATALTSANAMAGIFTGQSGNTSINGSSKKYANHTSTSNTSSSAPIWTWTWTAPASGTGDVKFYVATNKANN